MRRAFLRNPTLEKSERDFFGTLLGGEDAMPKLTRNPGVRWRVETHREERARRALADQGGAPEPGVDDLGTVTLLLGGVMHQLNLLGGEVWKLCDGNRDRRAVAEALLNVFDVDEATLQHDLALFFEDMISKGLIREE